MTTHARRLHLALPAAVLAFVGACGSVGGWHIDANNSTAETLIFRVSSAAQTLSWKVSPGESIAILDGSAVAGQISLLNPDTCATVASATLPTKPAVISAIYGRTPSGVAIEVAPHPSTERPVTLPDSHACK